VRARVGMRVRRLGKLAMLNKSAALSALSCCGVEAMLNKSAALSTLSALSCSVQNVAGCRRVLQCVAVRVPGIWEAGDAYKGCALSCCMLQCVVVCCSSQ